MKVIQSIDEIKEPFCVVFGNFDGVHLGHQYLIELTKKLSLELGAKLCVISFTPHPQTFFSHKSNFLISSEQLKQQRLRSNEVDFYLPVIFTQKVASLEAEDFLNQYVYRKGKLRGLVIGYDFALGKNRSGDLLFFKNFCHKNDIYLRQGNPIFLNEHACSSTVIRDAIKSNFLERANEILGSAFQISGVVKRGKGLGKKMGIPTINIYPDVVQLKPNFGVYITDILIKGVTINAVTNVGINPTTDQDHSIKIESHLLKDINLNINEGELIVLSFYKQLRTEKKFDSVDALISQIKCDTEEARKWHLIS